MQEVNWDDVNLLELGVLLDMAKDGYFFQIADGRIRSIWCGIKKVDSLFSRIS